MALNYSHRTPDAVSRDIIDLLPSDPFGMDIDISTTFTAITGWLEDLEMDYGRNNIVNTNEDYRLFAELNMIWNNAMMFQSFPSNGTNAQWVDEWTMFQSFPSNGTNAQWVDEWTMFQSCPSNGTNAQWVDEWTMLSSDNNIGDAGAMVDERTMESRFRDVNGRGVIHPVPSTEDITGFNHGSTSALVPKHEDLSDDFGGDPHEAFVFALGYLGTRDLLSVERVCKSLCSIIHDDSLLWRSIHIDQPLNERITDDILVQLTSRAEGNVQCLTLIKCPRITDDGLKRVLETNPKLIKLSVPGCTRLSIEGILNNLKAFKSSTSTSGIKHIRTGGFYGITHDHFKELNYLLGVSDNTQKNDQNPHYYHRGNFYIPSDDDRSIDVEICPKCQNLRLVYDCPAESCQVKDECRACIICIPRCAHCGRCVNNSEYEETFSLEFLCSDCIKAIPRCEKNFDG